MIERGVLMARGELLAAADLGLQNTRESGDQRRLDEMSLEEMERLLIQKALKRFGGNVSQAAEVLGLSRSALYRRMQKYEL
ncbi:MAG: helix-turn-helix domain-containing protein [Pyrinomonadaceae bacterium]